MLTGKLFHIIESNTINENELHTTFRCNVDHPIFEGHFPGSPVVPGVCMIQFVRERLSVLKNLEFSLFQARSIKFINVIDPVKEKNLSIEINAVNSDSGITEVSAIIKTETTNFFQFRGKYKEKNK